MNDTNYRRRSRRRKLRSQKRRRTLAILAKLTLFAFLAVWGTYFFVYGKGFSLIGRGRETAGKVVGGSASGPESAGSAVGRETMTENLDLQESASSAEENSFADETSHSEPAPSEAVDEHSAAETASGAADAPPASEPASLPLDPAKPMIAFTFDDGPFGKVDHPILDVLETYGGHVTFFIVGSRVADYPDTLKRIYNTGSEIGNHTFNHMNLEKLTPEEISAQIESVNDAVEAITGTRPRLVRVPYGAFGGEVKQHVAYPMIQWNVDTEDWQSKDKDAVVQSILSHAADGNIILMHDLYPTTAEAFVEAVPQLVAQGFQLVTVSELFAARGVPLEPGKVYFDIHQSK